MKSRYFKVFLLGILSSFSLPYFSLFPLMACGFVFYFYELNKSSNLRKSFLLGLAFGFGYFLVSLHWIIFPLFFDKKHFLLIPFVLIFSPLFLGIFFALPSLLIIYLKENFLVLKEKIFISSFVTSIIIFSCRTICHFICSQICPS